MGTNGIEIATENRIEEEILRIPHLEAGSAPRFGGAPLDDSDFALAPLVNKIAFGIARGLVVAMKELEVHIATETRKVGDAVDRRLETLQASLHEVSEFVSGQRSINRGLEEQCRQLAAGIKESDTRLAADLAALSNSVTQRLDTTAATLRESDARQASDLAALSTSVAERFDAAAASLQESDVHQASDLAALSTSVAERFDAAAASLKESGARQASDLGALSASVTERFAAAAASFRESDARRAFELAALTERIDSLCKELGVHQEDIAAIKSTLCTFSSRVDGLVERLDRQADAVRSICAAYSQRETELEQLVDGLARLRAYPTPQPVNGL